MTEMARGRFPLFNASLCVSLLKVSWYCSSSAAVFRSREGNVCFERRSLLETVVRLVVELERRGDLADMVSRS
jgi:hypothetical protein